MSDDPFNEVSHNIEGVAGITAILVSNFEVDYNALFDVPHRYNTPCIVPITTDDRDDENCNYFKRYGRVWKVPREFKTGDIIFCKTGGKVKGFHDSNLKTESCKKCKKKKCVIRTVEYPDETATGFVSERCKNCGDYTPFFVGGFSSQITMKICTSNSSFPKLTTLDWDETESPESVEPDSDTPDSESIPIIRYTEGITSKDDDLIFPSNTPNAMIFGKGKIKLVGCRSIRDMYTHSCVFVEVLKHANEICLHETGKECLFRTKNSLTNWRGKGELHPTLNLDENEFAVKPVIAMINSRISLDFDIFPDKMYKFLFDQCSDIIDLSTFAFVNSKKPYMSMYFKRDEDPEEYKIKGWKWRSPVCGGDADDGSVGDDKALSREITIFDTVQNTRSTKSVTFKLEPPRQLTFTILYYNEHRIPELLRRIQQAQDDYFAEDEQEKQILRTKILSILDELLPSASTLPSAK